MEFQSPSGMLPFTTQTMAVSIVAGTNGLLQLGLSISDLALLIDQGKKFGNFVRAGQNDDDLFDILDEDREALLQRRGLVETSVMERTWPVLEFIRQGMKKRGKIHQGRQTQSQPQEMNIKRKRKDKNDSVDGFTWVMVAVVSALDECLPASEIQELLIRVFVTVLNHDDDNTETALRVHIKTNIESWRSFGCARGIAHAIKKDMRKNRMNNPVSQQSRAIPQLNTAEKIDMENLLVWLLRNDLRTFSAMSAITFSVAEAWRVVKLDLCTDGKRTYETQACVTFSPDKQLFQNMTADIIPFSRGLNTRTLQISWPRGNPKTMIEALGVDFQTYSEMQIAWDYGTKAADDVTLIGGADGPYEVKKEVFYNLKLSSSSILNKRFPSHIGILAKQGFPADTHKVYEALEQILQEDTHESPVWLQQHVAQDYLLRVEKIPVAVEQQYKPLLCKYQALVFGFYYRLLEQLLSFELVDPTAFFHGIWGTESATFLAMCTQFSHCLRTEQKVTRAHILYMLATMYNGRRKVFNPSASIAELVGVIGPISILALPLIRATDVPEEIWKFAVVDLPIVDLNADNGDGELLASEGGGIRFVPASEYVHVATAHQPADPNEKWSVHPHMSTTVAGEKTSGVVMAARRGKRLVGWFNPLAADITFLSSAYLRFSYSDSAPPAFEVKTEHWDAGYIPQPDADHPGFDLGIVRCQNSPSLRYAVTGFYAEQGEEIAIAASDNEIGGAFDRIQGQGQGMVIA
jgi:hypothetical protein